MQLANFEEMSSDYYYITPTFEKVLANHHHDMLVTIFNANRNSVGRGLSKHLDLWIKMTLSKNHIPTIVL